MRHKDTTYSPTPDEAKIAYDIFRKLRGQRVPLAEHVCVTILATIASMEGIELSCYSKPGWEIVVRRVRGVDDSETVNPTLRVISPMFQRPPF